MFGYGEEEYASVFCWMNIFYIPLTLAKRQRKRCVRYGEVRKGYGMEWKEDDSPIITDCVHVMRPIHSRPLIGFKIIHQTNIYWPPHNNRVIYSRSDPLWTTRRSTTIMPRRHKKPFAEWTMIIMVMIIRSSGHVRWVRPSMDEIRWREVRYLNY